VENVSTEHVILGRKRLKTDQKSWFLLLVKTLEAFVYKKADAAIVTSIEILDHVARLYKPRNLVLIPNYVDTDIFKPLNITKKAGSICFIGRISPEKNLVSLVKALKGSP
jgi:glycosyltransferase involved in cell wall biosynthesis